MAERDYLYRNRYLFQADGKHIRIDVWDTGRRDWRGQSYLGYSLRHGDEELFSGDTFTGSPLHADDSKQTLAALLSFLSLKPGDTDADYFAAYSKRQLEWVSTWGDWLSLIAEELEGEVEDG